MSADHDHPARISSAKPGENVHDVHLRFLWVTLHHDHCRVELDPKASATIPAVTVQAIEEETSRRADAPRGAHRIGHRMTRAERDDDGIGFADARARYVAKQRR